MDMIYQFNKKIEWDEVNSYQGKPVVIELIGEHFAIYSKHMATVIESPLGKLRAKYLLKMECFGEILEKPRINLARSEWVFTKTSDIKLRTPTLKEYKTYKNAIMKYVIYDRWL